MMRFTGFIALLLGLFALTSLASAQNGPATVSGMDPRTYDLWNRHWRRIAMKVIAFEGDYAAMPLWEPRFPSSRQMTPDMYRKSKAVVVREKYGGAMVREVQVMPSEEEGRIAAMTIPAMAPGHYGYIHSFEVEEVLGPEQMMVNNIWLIDKEALKESREKYEEEMKRKAESREATEATDRMFEARDAAEEAQRDRQFRTPMRLVGFPTKGLHPKDRWPNKGDELPIAIAVYGDEPKGEGKLTRRRQLVVGPSEWMHRTLTEAQFIDMLKKRGLTPTQFVEMVTQTYRNEKDPEAADAKVFAEFARRREAALEAAAAQKQDKTR